MKSWCTLPKEYCVLHLRGCIPTCNIACSKSQDWSCITVWVCRLVSRAWAAVVGRWGKPPLCWTYRDPQRSWWPLYCQQQSDCGEETQQQHHLQSPTEEHQPEQRDTHLHFWLFFHGPTKSCSLCQSAHSLCYFTFLHSSGDLCLLDTEKEKDQDSDKPRCSSDGTRLRQAEPKEEMETHKMLEKRRREN